MSDKEEEKFTKTISKDLFACEFKTDEKNSSSPYRLFFEKYYSLCHHCPCPAIHYGTTRNLCDICFKEYKKKNVTTSRKEKEKEKEKKTKKRE